jgi:hypothetical protein
MRQVLNWQRVSKWELPFPTKRMNKPEGEHHACVAVADRSAYGGLPYGPNDFPWLLPDARFLRQPGRLGDQSR